MLFRDLSFEVKKRDRLFIMGPNGCGKSTLIKILLEQLHADAGKIEFGYNVTVGYYDQENQNLNERNTVLEELPLETYRACSQLFDEDLYEAIDLVKCVQTRSSLGGPAEASVQMQIDFVKEQLSK